MDGSNSIQEEKKHEDFAITGGCQESPPVAAPAATTTATTTTTGDNGNSDNGGNDNNGNRQRAAVKTTAGAPAAGPEAEALELLREAVGRLSRIEGLLREVLAELRGRGTPGETEREAQDFDALSFFRQFG